MDTGFEREAFYIEPPSKDASKEVWHAWIDADNKKAAVAKMLHTKSQEQQVPVDFADTTTRKVDGVWQSCTAIGFSGDFESGNGTLEIAVDATQGREFNLREMEALRHTRGSKSKSKSARRRANKKKKGKK
jgi:hypothetical protein